MKPEDKQPSPGDNVVLTELPPGLLDGLPQEDRQAINEAAGKPLLLKEYSDDETAELQFADSAGQIHFTYVNRTFVRRV